MIELKDQMNNLIRLENTPKRIISLVPSQTELLYDLGVQDRLLGVTKFCIHPKECLQEKTRIGGTKNINFDKIKSLKPELIIANKEENTKEIIETLRLDYQVYVSDINTVEEALQMIEDIGMLCDANNESVKIIDKIHKDFEEINLFKGEVLYFIWKNPYMIAAKNTFINDLIEKLGFKNVAIKSSERYSEMSLDVIKNSTAEYLLLSSEPFPFSIKDQKELELKTGKKVILLDGEMFSWYGSRMMKMKEYFKSILPQFLESNL